MAQPPLVVYVRTPLAYLERICLSICRYHHHHQRFMFSGFNLKSFSSLSKPKEPSSSSPGPTPRPQGSDPKGETSRSPPPNGTTLDSPKVLYCDLNGFWEPLELLYFSLSNRRLVARHKESATEEVVSHYCPACITRYMEDEVIKYRDVCPNCKECPVCFCTLVVISSEGKSYYECGYCSWRSPFTAKDASSLNQTVSDLLRSHSQEEVFQTLLDSYEVIKKKPAALIKGRPQGETWKLSDIENIIEERNKPKTFSPLDESKVYRAMKPIKSIENSLVQQLHLLPSLDQRLRSSDYQPANFIELLPVPVKLRVKRMVRCRKDVLDGALSIVLQPKTFPLEGDSSHKLQKGKWWVKNSCAAVEIPSIIIRKLPEVSALKKGVAGYLHLLVENPRENAITVRLGPGNKDDLEAAVQRRLPYPRQSWLSTTPKEFDFSLEAKEDELLKNSEAMAELQDVSLAPVETFSWSIVCFQNQARVCIPVMPDKDAIGDQSCVYKLLLKMRIQEHDPALKTSAAPADDNIIVQIIF